MNRVNDQVRKRQKRISNVTEDGEKHSMIWGMFMTVTMEGRLEGLPLKPQLKGGLQGCLEGGRRA